ncbi:DNA photolyase family protein [Weeksellaceae bacterium KMM 9724]|uniref:cryptochrome/photolyase family protein n=1 Tax=Profundicola chukchiensis TaxID=2961959 RepID=UPI0024394031|nr:deoxyribodipyrimidine photo-lyase [Profundicola chukchiensis]MDG4949692.1 DNA photolyase family protein [Profundicola chukchiensis]
MKEKVNLFWFRRDLRLEDNIGLSHALKADFPVVPIFIYDKNILDQLEDKSDRRVDFIHQVLHQLNHELKKHNSSLKTYYGDPLSIFKELEKEFEIQQIYCNRDYEPYAIKRDKSIYESLKQKDIEFKAFKDQVIFDKNEILKKDETPYTVYSYYAKKWKEKLKNQNLTPAEIHFNQFKKIDFEEIISLDHLGFQPTEIIFKQPTLDADIIDEYDQHRNFPTLEQTTKLGIHLRFGTISIRKCVAFAREHNEVWLSELIWREFFMQILYHFPHVANRAFKNKYDNIPWRNNLDEFEKWCNGMTGYPIVDAGMRQLNQTGFMHNRVRMIVASFLCKHLLIDWRWGEAYFAQKLDDYDLAANNGNWQWAAGTGCDAAPYFRVFNPYTQTERFDKNYEYIKQWVPEYKSKDYPAPMVEHKFARERAISTYKNALNPENS